MDPSLLPLLLLLASLQAGGSKECNPKTDFGVNQPESLSAPKGGSICISFSYFYCWELAQNPSLSIALRRTEFHGQYIYNSTWPFIHKDYKDRISLDLKQGQDSGALCISNLRKYDENKYFVQVQVKTLRDGWQRWQSIPGTKLTITRAAQMTTEGPTNTTLVTVTTTTRDMSMETMVKVAVPIAVFKTVILGLVVYLWWKSSKG